MSIKYPERDLTQELKMYMASHQTTTRASHRPPISSDGINGDITIVRQSIDAELFAKADGQWFRFRGASSSSSKPVHVMNGAFSSSDNSAMYLPIGGGIVEGSDNTTSAYSFMWPYKGRVKKIMFRAEGDLGNTNVHVYRAKDGTDNPDIEIETYTQNMTPDDTPYSYLPQSCNFQEGQVMSIKIDATSNYGDLLFTIVLEYDY